MNNDKVLEIFKTTEQEIKRKLKLGDEIKVLTGEEAKQYIQLNEEKYQKDYNVSLKENYEKTCGTFLWFYDENIVLVNNPIDLVNLAHELRHAWQYQHKKSWFKKKEKKKNKLLYIFSIKEIDANWFALKYGIYLARRKVIAVDLSRPILALLPFFSLIGLLIFILYCILVRLSSI